MNKNNWVFIRGLSRGNIHWAEFPQILKNYNPEVKMEFLEIPGNGELYQEDSPTSCLELIEILREKSHFFKNKIPFNLCGISLGGMIALKWAELYPEDLVSLSVINTSLKQFSPFTQRLLLHNYSKIIISLFSSSCQKQEQLILEMTSNNEMAWKKKLIQYAEYASSHTFKKKNFVRQLLLAGDIHIENIPLHLPTKIICAKNDSLVSHNCSLIIAEKLKSKVYLHPSAGHDLPLDDPEWLAEILMS